MRLFWLVVGWFVFSCLFCVFDEYWNFAWFVWFAGFVLLTCGVCFYFTGLFVWLRVTYVGEICVFLVLRCFLIVLWLFLRLLDMRLLVWLLCVIWFVCCNVGLVVVCCLLLVVVWCDWFWICCDWFHFVFWCWLGLLIVLLYVYFICKQLLYINVVAIVFALFCCFVGVWICSMTVVGFGLVLYYELVAFFWFGIGWCLRWVVLLKFLCFEVLCLFVLVLLVWFIGWAGMVCVSWCLLAYGFWCSKVGLLRFCCSE